MISARFHSLTRMSRDRNDQERKDLWPKRPVPWSRNIPIYNGVFRFYHGVFRTSCHGVFR